MIPISTKLQNGGLGEAEFNSDSTATGNFDGGEAERWVCQQITRRNDVGCAMLLAQGIDLSLPVTATVTGGTMKSDVTQIIGGDSRNAPRQVGISIKKFNVKGGSNQLFRFWPRDYFRSCGISERTMGWTEDEFGGKRYHPGLTVTGAVSSGPVKRQTFLHLAGSDREAVVNDFQGGLRNLLEIAFKGIRDEKPEWLMTIQAGKTLKWAVIPISDILDMCVGDVAISNKGNLKLGKYVTGQRKGGDSGTLPACQFQLKLNVERLTRDWITKNASTGTSDSTTHSLP